MSGSVDGDFKGLADIQRRLDEAPKAIPMVKEEVAPLFQASALQAIESGTSIGGRPLGDKAVTFERGTRSPRNRSGGLIATLRTTTSSEGVTTAFQKAYAKYATNGFFPQELPRNWLGMLRDAAQKALTKVLDG